MLNHVEGLFVSVQQHSELFDTIQKSLATQQTVMSDMMLKLSKLERGNYPPLLPSPPMPSSMGSLAALGMPSSPGSTPPFQPRLPKLEIPLFNGDNVLSWIF